MDTSITNSSMVLPNALSLFPRLDPCAHYFSKQIPMFAFGLLRGSVCYLHASVHLLAFFIKGLVTKYSSLQKSAVLVTFERWFCCLSCLHPVTRSSYIFSVCQVGEVVCGKFRSSTMTGFLIAIVRINPNTHCGAIALLIACQNTTNNGGFCLSCTLKVNGLLALSALTSPFKKGSEQSNIGCEASSKFWVIVTTMWSHAPFGLFQHARYHTFLCPSPQKHQ